MSTTPIFNSALYNLTGERGTQGPIGPTGPAGPGALFYYNNNQVFGGSTLSGTTSGHVVSITALKNSGTVVRCDVSMARLGGVCFNMPNVGTTGANSQAIATLPVDYRPTTNIISVGNSSNDNGWATNSLNWGAFQLGTDGKIVQRCNATTSITDVQPSFEQIAGSLYFMADGNASYTGDGIL